MHLKHQYRLLKFEQPRRHTEIRAMIRASACPPQVDSAAALTSITSCRSCNRQPSACGRFSPRAAVPAADAPDDFPRRCPLLRVRAADALCTRLTMVAHWRQSVRPPERPAAVSGSISAGPSPGMGAMCLTVVGPTWTHDTRLPSRPRPTAELHLSGCA